ncbi:MAG: AsmA-like C-terminal region-containing protein [Hyphomicrobiaceae bacterium]
MSETADKSRRYRANRGQTFIRGGRATSNRWFRRVVLVICSILMPIGLLIAAGCGLLYVKLLNGPIALPFLNDAIAGSISSQLQGVHVKIDSTLLALRGSTVELQLKNIVLRNEAGKLIAASPSAAIELRESRIIYGEFSPASIVLIRPKVKMRYGLDGHVSFSLTRTQNDGGGEMQPPPADGTRKLSAPREEQLEVDAEQGRSVLVTAVAQLVRHVRAAPGSGLSRVGFREGSLIVQHAGGQTTLQMPKAEINLGQGVPTAPSLSGRVSLLDRRGLATLAFTAEMDARSDNFEIETRLENFWPEMFAGLLPSLSVLSALKVPLSGVTKIVLDRGGGIVAGDAVIEVGGGQLAFPGWKGPQPLIESARLHIQSGQNGDDIVVRSAMLRWAKSEIVLSGMLKPAASEGNTELDFEFKVNKGRLWTGLAHTAVKEGWAKGRLDLSDGLLHVRKAAAKTENGGVEFSAQVHMGKRHGLVARARVAPSSVHEALAFWPTFVNPDARSWVVDSVTDGATQDFEFSMRWLFPSVPADASGPTEYAMVLKVDLQQAEIHPDRRLPPIRAPSMMIEIKDHAFSARMPKAELVVSSQQRLNVTDFLFDVEDIFRTEMDGTASFRVVGALTAGLAVARELDDEQRGLIDKYRQAVGGQIAGRFNVVVPLYRKGQLPPPTASGQLKVSNGYGKDIWQGYGLSDAEVGIDLNRDGIVASGRLRVAGIPAQLNFQQFYGIANEEQPPLRLRTTLQSKDRARLGLQTRHSIDGPVDLDVVFPVASGDAAQPDARIRVDLGKADIFIESLAWRKPAGKPAAIDIDLFAAPDESADLRNINLAGDGVAVRGSAKIDRTGKLLTFDVQDLSLDVVTNLQLKGERREGDVWRVSARGATFEGRQFFSSLFSTGRHSGETKRDEPGLDLDVRIGTVLGYWDSRMSEFQLDLSKRNGNIVALHATGKLGKGRTVTAVVRRGEKRRRLITTSNDAGAVFKLVGFYPSLVRGGLEAVVNLDGRRAGEKTGRIDVRKFGLLGDEFISEVLQTPEGRTDWARRGESRTIRQVVEFDWMKIPFQVGRGQFVMRDVELRGPVLGVLLCGRADFNSRRLQLAGTYVPLQGLSSIFGAIPGVGELLTGPKGAGIVGINFEIKGAMQRPQVLVNPLSAITPGIFREVFQIACPKSQYVHESRRSGKRQRRGRPVDDWATRTLQR